MRTLLKAPRWNPFGTRTSFRRLTLMTLITSLMAGGGLSSQPGMAQVKQSEQNPLEGIYEPREYVGSNEQTLKYRLLKPFNFVIGEKYPLVVFLHGAGERGDDNVKPLTHGVKDFADEQRRKEYPAYVIVPQCPTGQRWAEVSWSEDKGTMPSEPSPSMFLLKELIDEMIESAGVDTERIYITGLSMGGFGTWDAIARYPDLFAAAAPICGGGDTSTAEKIKDLPIWCFHGGKDTVVIPARSRNMIDALKEAGSTVQYTEYPDLAHDSWTVTYANPELYRWLFSQRRKPAE